MNKFIWIHMIFTSKMIVLSALNVAACKYQTYQQICRQYQSNNT